MDEFHLSLGMPNNNKGHLPLYVKKKEPKHFLSTDLHHAGFVSANQATKLGSLHAEATYTPFFQFVMRRHSQFVAHINDTTFSTHPEV